MNHFFKAIFKLLPFVTLIFAASLNGLAKNGRPRKRYDGHQILRVHTETPEQVQLLRELPKRNIQIEYLSSPPVQPGLPFEILVTPKDQHVVQMIFNLNGLHYEVLVPNVQIAIDSQSASGLKMTDGSAPITEEGFSFDDYHPWIEIEEWLHEFSKKHPDLVHLIPLGKTHEDRTILLVKISASSGETRPSIWLDSGIHSNEWIGPATLLYFIKQLVYGYEDGDRETMWLVDNLDWYILPVFNVDGYVYTWTHDRLWRKNRANYGNGTCIGVDLNRNWPYHWGEGNADHEPCGRMYVGPSAASEPEIKAVVDFLSSKRASVRAYLAYHSFSQFWMLPWSYTKDILPPEYEAMMNVSRAAVRALHSVHGTEYQIGRISKLIGEASGASVDFTLSIGIKYSFGIELRDDGRHGTLLPSNQIIPNAEESYVAAKEVAFIIIDEIYAEEGYTNF